MFGAKLKPYLGWGARVGGFMVIGYRKDRCCSVHGFLQDHIRGMYILYGTQLLRYSGTTACGSRTPNGMSISTTATCRRLIRDASIATSQMNPDLRIVQVLAPGLVKALSKTFRLC